MNRIQFLALLVPSIALAKKPKKKITQLFNPQVIINKGVEAIEVSPGVFEIRGAELNGVLTYELNPNLPEELGFKELDFIVTKLADL